MLRIGLAMIAATLLALLASTSTVQQGVRDLWQSATHLPYDKYRDMRLQVLLVPQRSVDAVRLPDTTAVPMTGRQIVTDRELLGRTLRNPVAAADSSIARGERKFLFTCTPCHGTTLAGNGPVSVEFIPPPDLLGASVRARSDGFIWATIRYGGAVMPVYGAQVTAEEAWNIVNYIRHMQKTNPR